MTTDKLKKWQSLRRSRKLAEQWQDLPNGQKYQKDDSFSISIAHSSRPKLTRCGQKTCGGKNYWETEKEMGDAILEYIVKNWGSIGNEVIEIMRDKEKSALKDCQEFIDKMQAAINDV